MPIPQKLVALVALAVPLGLGVGGCKQKSEPVSQVPTGTDAAGAAPGAVAVDPMPQGEVEMIRLRGSIENVDDILVALKEINARIEPDQPSDPKAEVQASLLQMGFGPGFLANIDLQGLHAFAFAFPQSEETASPDAAEFSGSVAVHDGRKLIESTPPAFRPQPLGDGVWEFKQNQNRVLLREAGKELLLGLDPQDLERAAGLRGQAGQAGRRVRLHAANIPVDDIDPVELLGLSPQSPLAQNLGRVIQEASGFDVEVDLGTDRDVELLGGAQAPFHQLGIEPLGQPRAASTALESRLPPDPVFVTTLSWGDPALVHELMDEHVPVDQVPPGFREIVSKTVGGIHTLLDQVANDVVVAVYLDAKGKASVLLAADVRDDAKTRKAMRGMNEAIASAVEAQRTMAGKNKDGQFDVDYKPDGLGISGGKADKLTLTIAKDFLPEFEKGSIFLDKNKLETVSFTRDETAVVIIGAGGRNLASDIARFLGKTRKDSLARSDGLERVRESMGGCQICVAGDPLEYLRLRLTLLRATAEDKGVSKKATAKLRQLRKLESLGEPSAGLKVEREAASVAVVIPKKAAYAPTDAWAALREMFEFVDDPTQPETPPTAKPSKPGKGQKKGQKKGG